MEALQLCGGYVFFDPIYQCRLLGSHTQLSAVLSIHVHDGPEQVTGILSSPVAVGGDGCGACRGGRRVPSVHAHILQRQRQASPSCCLVRRKGQAAAGDRRAELASSYSGCFHGGEANPGVREFGSPQLSRRCCCCCQQQQQCLSAMFLQQQHVLRLPWTAAGAGR